MNEESRLESPLRRITGSTRVACVMGSPVGHSLSPPMHNAAYAELDLDWVYVPFEVAPKNLEAALRAVRVLNIVGVNLTVPLKEVAMPLLDEVSVPAKRIGAVNMVTNAGGRLVGDNTDWTAFSLSLGDDAKGKARSAFVYGAGGSARAVAYALQMQEWRVYAYNRNEARANRLALDLNREVEANCFAIEVVPNDDVAVREALRQSSLLVNCTPVGMHPLEDAIPDLPIDETELHISFIYDLIYRPQETQLLKVARKSGRRAMNGAEMLVRQGAVAFERWTGQKAPVAIMRQALLKSLAE